MGYRADSIRSIPCEHMCGFHRPYNAHPDWLEQVIQHPVWGVVTQARAAALDIRWHDCGTYLDALSRARKRFNGPTRTPQAT